ncbi:MAG: TonB-dependent receptor, partial [Sphingomonadales bacterium]
VNMPLAGDRVAIRAVGYGISEGGYIDDVWRNRKDVNRTRIAGGRATVRVDAGDGWTIDAGGVYQDNQGRDSQYADRILGGLKRASRTPGGFDADYALGELVIGKSWDSGISFLSSSGFVRQHLDERYDATTANVPNLQFTQRNRTSMFASENRLWRPMRDGHGWVLGASYTRNRTDLERSLGPVGTPAPVTGVANKVRELTIYGEASVEPLRGLTITGGARYTRSRLGGGADDEDPLPAFAPAFDIAARAAIVAARTEKRLLPSASISASLLPGLTVYARYQQGFRPGGLAIESGYVRRFRNDRVQTMETGLRYGVRGRDPFDLSLSLSYTDWDEIQAVDEV